MSYINPTIDQFKARFARDFPFGDSPDTVNDNDIANAYIAVNNSIGGGDFFPTQEAYTPAYFLLAAHNLVLDLRASSLGISGGFQWLEQSKSVGNVSQSFAIPQSILDNPYFAMLMTTPYGARYVMLLLPYMVGASFIAFGTTLP